MSKRRSEKVKEELRRLALVDDNKTCMDCGMRGPLYVVTDFHIFVCSQCSAVHRSMQHKVKGISMSEFTDEELAGARLGGNRRAKAIWMQHFTATQPKEGDERAVKDFVRQVFVEKRYFNSNELGRLIEEIQAAGLPPVVPLPLSMIPGEHVPKMAGPPAQTQVHVEPSQLSATQAFFAQQIPTVPAAQVQQQPVQVPQQQQQQVYVAQPVVVPAQPKAKPADIFDDFFAAPSAGPSVQAVPQEQPSAQKRLDMDHLFGGHSGPISPPPTVQMPADTHQPQQQYSHYAAQQQVYSGIQSNIPSGNAAYAAQVQVASNQRPVTDFFGTGAVPTQYAAQHQMAPTPQAFVQNSSYAAQHQMNSTSYGAGRPTMDFFQQPQQPGAWTPQNTASSIPQSNHFAQQNVSRGATVQPQAQHDVFAALDPFGAKPKQ